MACVWCSNADCRTACLTPARCPAKTAASWLDGETLVCLSPPAHAAPAANYSLELTFDGHYFTSLGTPWSYFDPVDLAISYLDPAGSPHRARTLATSAAAPSTPHPRWTDCGRHRGARPWPRLPSPWRYA